MPSQHHSKEPLQSKSNLKRSQHQPMAHHVKKFPSWQFITVMKKPFTFEHRMIESPLSSQPSSKTKLIVSSVKCSCKSSSMQDALRACRQLHRCYIQVVILHLRSGTYLGSNVRRMSVM